MCSTNKVTVSASQRGLKSLTVILRVETKEGLVDYAIVNDEEERSIKDKIYYYKDPLARELLTAAYYEERNKKGEFNGIGTFEVKKRLFKSLDNKENINRIKINSITIRAKGGYYTSNRASDEEYVDVLVYSPFKKVYVTVSVTRDSNTGECFIDYKKFRDFAYAYGKPDIIVKGSIIRKQRKQNGQRELNEESILKAYGYCVDSRYDPGKDRRRQILKDLVDLEIMDVSTIVNYLDFFIEWHSEDIYEIARSKWEADKKVISEYRVDPERFLIAEKAPKRITLYD